ncbi:hypothetical protein GCM10010435_14900 [Winogradskya consettensis]|uniref:Uncharacterized protein n=1 Tax=Winogradskya consettensis TaxID=113560 RepID=A0A919VMM8_9ACTN|nr:hypothetical protein [Actinoplanes consettensis]GIM69197.1 hypothetical protein Aco04nite_14170 [Actinoplanes consettensis]
MSDNDIRLLQRLAGEPAGPGRVDVRQAVSEGRRRLRRRKLAAGAALAVLVAAVPVSAAVWSRPAPSAPASRPDSCEPGVKLPMPVGSKKSFVVAGDRSARYLAGEIDGRAALWHDGTLEVVAEPGGPTRFTAVNSAGLAVGVGKGKAWTYAAGTFTQLASPTAALATAVSENGIVVGAREQDNKVVPAVWDSIEATARDLPTRNGESGQAVWVSDEGIVLGLIRGTYYRWGPSAGYTNEIDLDGEKNLSLDTAVTNGQMIAGSVTVNGKEAGIRAYLLSDAQRLPDDVMEPTAINSRNWIAGSDPLAGGAKLLVGDTLIAVPGGGRAVITAIATDGGTLGGYDGEAATTWRCQITG